MNNRDKQHTDDFVKRAQARIERMKRAAQELTQGLDLPREATYDVLATIAKQAPPEALIEVQAEHDELDTVSPQLRSQPLPFMEQPGKAHRGGKQNTSSGFPKRRGRGLYWMRMLAAVILVALLVGSLVLVLNIARQNKIGTHPPAADQSGLYVAASDGVYRLDQHGGTLGQRWYYVLSAPWTKQAFNRIKSPAPFGYSLVDSPVTVVDGVAYFGGLEDDPANHQPHHYLYAINAANGALLWRHRIDGNGSGIQGPEIITSRNSFSINLGPGRVINAPQVWHDMVFLNVSSSMEDHYIVALARNNGALRWTHKYPVNKLLAAPGQMAAIENGLIYVANDNTIFALRADNGQQRWRTQVPQQTLPGQQLVIWQTFETPQSSDGVVFVVYAVQGDGPATSSIYAFNAANGSQLWHSQAVDDLVTSLTVTQGVVYFASLTHWHVYALHAHDGTLFWDYSAGGQVSATPQVMNGVVYVKAFIPGSSPTDSGQTLSVIALDSMHGTHLRTYPLPLNTPFDLAGQLLAGQGVIYVSTVKFVYSIRASNGSIIQAYRLGTSVPARLTLVP